MNGRVHVFLLVLGALRRLLRGGVAVPAAARARRPASPARGGRIAPLAPPCLHVLLLTALLQRNVIMNTMLRRLNRMRHEVTLQRLRALHYRSSKTCTTTTRKTRRD